MNEAEFNRLMEDRQRRTLGAAEEIELEAFLATRPDLRLAWEDELGLDQMLRRLPAAPMASNFTAQVMQTVDRETRPEPAVPFVQWLRHVVILRWARATAMACILLGAGVLTLHQYRVHATRQMADTLKQLTPAPGADIPSVETLKDFDAINRLSQASRFVDEDLLAVPE